MSSLALIRHAQASFFAAEYDELSPLGVCQAERLGRYWVSQRRTVDAAYVGPRRRHQQTAAVVAGAHREAGLTFPEPVALPELDEYDLDGILGHVAPELARQSEDFAALYQRQRHGETEREQARNFQRMFEWLMGQWIIACPEVEGVELWPAFQARVQRGVERMTNEHGRGHSVVAFTSGGFIGAAMQLVLGAPPRAALEINWRIRNASVTEFVFSRGRISLDAFNSTAHLDDPDLLTYR